MIDLTNVNHTLNNQSRISFITKENNSCFQLGHFNGLTKILKGVFLNNKMAGEIHYLDEQHVNQKFQGIFQISHFTRHPEVRYKNNEVTIILCIIILIIIRSGIALRKKSIFFILYLGIAKIAFIK